jgi:hypothetical protein
VFIGGLVIRLRHREDVFAIGSLYTKMAMIHPFEMTRVKWTKATRRGSSRKFSKASGVFLGTTYEVTAASAKPATGAHPRSMNVSLTEFHTSGLRCEYNSLAMSFRNLIPVSRPATTDQE